MAEKRNSEKRVELGVVGRPHGVKGAFRLSLHNPASKFLTTGGRVELDTTRDGGPLSEHRIAAVQRSGKHCIVSLEGIDRREQAEELTGARLLVPRDALPALEDGEFYVDDLMGIDVWQAGRLLGAIVESREQGGIEVVRVRGEDGDIEIPLVDEFVVSIDVRGGRVEVRDTEDLPHSERPPRSGDRV